jgi:16S rRNA (cytosine967-C5)-methyltransferase
LDRVGFDACERWCDFNNAIPDVAVRALSRDSSTLQQRLDAEGVDAVSGEYVGGAIRLRPGSLGRLSPETAGLLFIQDEASQLVATLAGAQPGERILDVCASPGGKTLILEQAAGQTGLVISADRSARVGLLRTTLVRASAPTRVLALDAAGSLPFGAVFDRVLLDAPCSGLGTVSRDPDIKWHRAETDLPRFAATQQRMLEAAATVVRPGGSLIYATCSSEPVENEGVVDRFLARSPGFALAPLDPALALERAARTIDARGMLRTLPFRDGLDAFFAARLVRRDTA